MSAQATLDPQATLHDSIGRGRVRSRHRVSLRDAAHASLFVGPNIVLIAGFLFLPLVLAVVLSFQRYSGFGSSVWIGFDNYRRLFADDAFWRSLVNTGIFALFTVPVGMAVGLGLAVLMNSVLPGRSVYRAVIYLPMVISGVATGLIGTFMFDENVGTLNKMLRAVHLGTLNWQSSGAPAIASVILVTLWIRLGFDMVIYLAGLQGISPELYEAARTEGANGWQTFRSITVPLVGPSTFFLVIMNVIYTFQIFDTVFVLTNGGPGFSTSVLGTYAYANGFGPPRAQGYAAAIGVVIFVLTLAFTVVQWRVSRTRDLAG